MSRLELKTHSRANQRSAESLVHAILQSVDGSGVKTKQLIEVVARELLYKDADSILLKAKELVKERRHGLIAT